MRKEQDTAISKKAKGEASTPSLKISHNFDRVMVHARYPMTRLQPKLKVSQAGDQYERQADAIADQVTQFPSSPGQTANRANLRTKLLPAMPKPGGAGGMPAPPGLASQLAHAGSEGAPFASPIRQEMEEAFSFDFSQVRIHAGEQAASMAQSLQARAFTHGQDIFFNRGQYGPVHSAGKRLLAHELAHVVQQSTTSSAPALQRQGMSRDWQHEADRMTTAELEAEIQAIQAQLMEFMESNEETEQLSEGLAILERTLMQRQRGRIRFRQGLQSLRESQRQRAGESSAAGALEVAVLPQNAQVVFTMGFATGFFTELPPGEVLDAEQDLNEHYLQFTGGYLVGLPVGLWHGLTGLLEGLWTLAQLGARLSPAGILYTLGEQAWAFGSDPQGYIRQRRQEYEQVRAIARALQEFGEEFREDPSIVMQWSGDLGLALGEHMGGRFTDEFLRQSAYEKGYMVGDIAGMILFEILLEIILAVATEGVGNLIRGVAAVGQGLRAGGRLANVLRRMLEASPAIRRLLQALNRGEDVLDVARASERAIDAAEDVASAPARQRGGNVVDLDEYRRRRQAADRPPSEPAAAERPVELPEEQELPMAVGQEFTPSSRVRDPNAPRASAGEGGGRGGTGTGPGDTLGAAGPESAGTGSGRRPPDAVRPETGSELERSLIDEHLGSVRATGGQQLIFRGGGRRSLRTFYDEMLQHRRSGAGLPSRFRPGVLSQSTRRFIESHPDLLRTWERIGGSRIAEDMAQELARLRQAQRQLPTGSVEFRSLDRRITLLDDELRRVVDWETGSVGSKRPDLVEVFPERRQIVVTDITQTPFNEWHNFKTRFYAAAISEVFGGWETIAVDASRSVVRALTP